MKHIRTWELSYGSYTGRLTCLVQYQSGMIHGSPAMVWYSANGGVEEVRWCREGQFHRDVKPAVIWRSAYSGWVLEWYREGDFYSRRELGLVQYPRGPGVLMMLTGV